MQKIAYPFEGKFKISFRFGEAPEWYTKVAGYPHNGVDFALPVGTLLFSCSSGRVVYADNTPDSDGLGINILHEWGMSQYWHLSKVFATFGQHVNDGDFIGKSGASGWATGPHLHFGIKVLDEGAKNMHGWTDPLLYLEKEKEETPTPPTLATVYIVKKGDSLWKIAKKLYGEGIYWPKIYQENKKRIADPNLIHPGQELKIS